MATIKLKRRSMLRGLAAGGAVFVGLPALEAMFNANGTAHADGTALALRLGVFFWGNGVRLSHWIPSGTGPGFPLSRSLMPLAPVRSYVSVVSGLEIKIPVSQVHHTGTVGILSGAPVLVQPPGSGPFRSTFNKPSLDQLAAAELGKLTRFKSLEVGISRFVKKNEGTTLLYLSHNGPDSANPPLYDPRAVWNRLFGANLLGTTSPAAGGVSPDKIALLRKSVLDAVIGDIARLNARVSANDKRRLDQHLENIRGIEKRLAPAAGAAAATGAVGPGAACAVPNAPGAFRDTPLGEPLEPLMSVMSDLIAVALACDQTRVFSVMFSGSVALTHYWQVNVTREHHMLTHEEPGDQPQVQATTEFTMKMFGTLLQALKNTPEGAGNLLDASAIMATTDTAEGKDHSIRDFPLVVAGRAGGALKHPGVHHRGRGENTSMVPLSLLRAVGVPAEAFGDGRGRASSGLGAIERAS